MVSTTTLLIDELLVEQMSTEGQGCLLDALAERAALPRYQVKRAMKSGALWLTSTASGPGSTTTKPVRVRRLQRRLRAGDELTLYFHSEVLGQRCPDAVLVEDCVDYSVWNKPAGMLCQGSRWGDHTTLQRWIAGQKGFDRPVYMLHRLDKMTEGLILVAHSKRANQAFAKLFAGREIEKVYQAICVGVPEAEPPYRIEMPVAGQLAVTVIRSVKPAEQLICRSWQNYLNIGKEKQDYVSKSIENLETCMEKGLKFSLVTVSIETGRKHQVRQHLAGIGNPILGDRLINPQPQFEGYPLNDGFDLQLKACELKFLCPLSQKKKHYKTD